MTTATRYKVIDTALCIGESVFDGEEVVVLASDYDTLCDEWRVATGAVIMQRKELAELRDELAALKAGQGEAVAWRDHSVNYAKGEKCPATIETLQAAWDRDQELLLDQKSEISKLKETINQLRQKRSAPPATADAVSVPRELLHRLCPKMDARHWHQWNASEAYQAACELRALLAQSQEVKS